MSKTLIAARIALIGVLATLWPVTALSSDLSSLNTPIANILQRGGLEVREHRSVDKKKTSANPAQSFSSSKVTNGNGTGQRSDVLVPSVRDERGRNEYSVGTERTLHTRGSRPWLLTRFEASFWA